MTSRVAGACDVVTQVFLEPACATLAECDATHACQRCAGPWHIEGRSCTCAGVCHSGMNAYENARADAFGLFVLRAWVVSALLAAGLCVLSILSSSKTISAREQERLRLANPDERIIVDTQATLFLRAAASTVVAFVVFPITILVLCASCRDGDSTTCLWIGAPPSNDCCCFGLFSSYAAYETAMRQRQNIERRGKRLDVGMRL